MNNALAVAACAVGAILFLNVTSSPGTPVAAEPEPVPVESRFDYGDEHPLTPIPAARGATNPATLPVIDSEAAVTAADTSAFSDVPPPVEINTKPAGPVASAAPGSSAFSDVPAAPVKVPTPVASGAPATDEGWTLNVFPIKCVNSNGSAVAVGPGTLLTTFHVARYANAQIGVNNQWVAAAISHPRGASDGIRDAALVKVANGQFPSMNVRAPVYYEPVTVYGLRTQTRQRGFVSGASAVSLLPETMGVSSGDSGGAVVGDDGSLVGLISGSESGAQYGTLDNPRVVMMTRADIFLPYLPKSGMASTVHAGAGTSNLPEPVGSVFPPANQPSAFDPAPVTPATEQASCAAPNKTQATQSATTYYYQSRRQRRGR